MKIIVTGGAGFIGSHLVDRYIELGHEVVVMDNFSTGFSKNIHPKARVVEMDLSDTALEELVVSEKPDLINHHAAQINVRTSVDQPLFDLDINQRNTVRLLEAAKKAQVKKFIFASSGGTVYGETEHQPIPEPYSGTPLSPYGINKLASEHYLSFYSGQSGMRWTILRYANVYGPRQNIYGEAGVIAIFLDRVKRGLPPIIYGDGEQVRDYIHVEDIVSANMMFSHIDSEVGIYNVGTGKGTTLNRLVAFISEIIPEALPPVYEQERPGDLRWNILCVDKLRALGWQPLVNMKEGIAKLI